MERKFSPSFLILVSSLFFSFACTSVQSPTNTTDSSLKTDIEGRLEVLIDISEFQMGDLVDSAIKECEQYSSECDLIDFYDQEPIHDVSLASYYIDAYEVTNSQFVVFLNEKDNQEQNGSTWLDENDLDIRIRMENGKYVVDEGFEEHPIVEVTWYGAQAYCEWTGSRLPTEAEWEKAARGGLIGKLFPWGDDAPSCEQDSVNGAQSSLCPPETVLVGSYSPNGFGIYDMAGNVWEWVYDWYSEDYYGSSPLNNPKGPADGTMKVLRGGSWNAEPYFLRVAEREYLTPEESDDFIGFRCARTP